MPRCAIRLLPLMLGLGGSMLFGARDEETAGLPPVVIVSAKTMGVDGEIYAATEDRLGRLFVGSKRLLVYDGQTWRSFPMPKNNVLTSLRMGEDGRLWTGAINELGYFQENEPGAFQFNSLLSHLPEGARDVGIVWGCWPVGKATYFVCRNKLLRWDGAAFQTTLFATTARLFPMKMAGEWWFYHVESGLYRVKEEGPSLEVPATELRNLRIAGLFRDEIGLVTVSSKGFVRPGNNGEVAPFSGRELNDYLGTHLVSTFGTLPDGNLVVGTVSGGIVLASPKGQLIQVWNSNSGLPGRLISSLSINGTGEIFGITGGDFFHFPASSESTVFNSKNGLKGKIVNSIRKWNSNLYAVTEDGTFCQEPPTDGQASFKSVPLLTAVYTHILPYHNGLLLSRFGAVDRFDGTTVQTVCRSLAGNLLAILPARGDPRRFYVPEPAGLAQMDEQPDGTFLRKDLVEIPDTIVSLCEDFAGRLWIGTSTNGAFTYDPATGVLVSQLDPVSGEPLPGPIKFLGNDRQFLVFSDRGILQADANGQSLHAIQGVPIFSALEVQYAPNSQDIFITYQRGNGSSTPSSGAGVLSFTGLGEARWRELDIAALGVIGQVRTQTFSLENGRPILWLGGMDGILRVDYDKIPSLQPPPAPIISSTAPATAAGAGSRFQTFPSKDHHLRLTVFTGDYIRGKDWLIQTRFGTKNNEWSAASLQRSFEFTNLSDGVYRFEARTVNSADLAGPPASFSFAILPPWFRTNWAYAGYAAGLTLIGLGFTRLRELRIRARNRELENLVTTRTKELVQANAAKDEFLASISHEIRNPMNGIVGIAETLDAESLDPTNKNRLVVLRQCASHLASLLEDILDSSRIQAGFFDLNPSPFDLPDLVGSIAAFTAFDSEHFGVPLEIAISPTVPRLVTGDRRRVRQILLNFVSNALKFSGRGQVCVTVWGKKLSLGLTEVYFAVSDEGPGISPDEQQKLFTRFTRGRAARLSKVPGTGLGLALCKVLAEKMGGRVWLESESGLGSCFFFRAY